MASNKQRALLRVGEDLFSRYGYRDIAIEEITRCAGIGTGSFYHYFPSKEAFYEQILDSLERKGIQEAERVISRLRSPVNKLKALFRFVTLAVRKSPILLGILTGDRKYLYPGLPERNLQRQGLRAYIESSLENIIHEGTRQRVFRTSLFHNPAVMLITICDALLMKLHTAEAQDLMDDLLLLIERGLPRRVRLRQRAERQDRRAQAEQRPPLVTFR